MGLNLIGKIELDGAGFERGLRKAGDSVSELAKTAVVAAFGFYGVEEAIRKTVETATELVNESKRLDLTVEQLQLLRQAAKDGGTEMGTLASALEKVDIARAKALGGDRAALDAFAKLGVSQVDLKTQTAATLFTNQISGAVKGGNVENLAPVLKEVLGKGFGELIPVLKTDFDELGDKMHRLGSIMDTETAVKLKSAGDSLDLLKNIMAADLGPALISFIEIIFSAVGKLKEFGAYLGSLSSGGVGQAIKNKFKADYAQQAIDSYEAAVQGGVPDFLKGTSKKEYDDAKTYLEEYNKKQAEAGQAALDAGSEFNKTVQAMREKLAKEADELTHPKPIVPAIDAAKATHAARVQSDSLVKVGNFLGSNGNTISRVDQRKINLMEQHLTELKGIKQAIHTSGGTFATGIPHVT